MKQTIQDLLDILQDPIITIDPDMGYSGTYAIRVHREGKPDLAFMYGADDIPSHLAKQLEDLGNGTHGDASLQNAYDTGAGTIHFEFLPGHPRASGHSPGLLSCSTKYVRIHFSDGRGIVQYRSVSEASCDIVRAGRYLRAEKPLPSHVEWIEYMDSETEDLYREKRRALKQS